MTREWRRKKKGKWIKKKKDEKKIIESKITYTPSQIGQVIPSSRLKNPKRMAFLATHCSALSSLFNLQISYYKLLLEFRTKL